MDQIPPQEDGGSAFQGLESGKGVWSASPVWKEPLSGSLPVWSSAPKIGASPSLVVSAVVIWAQGHSSVGGAVDRGFAEGSL